MYKLTLHHPGSNEVEHDIKDDLVTVGRNRKNIVIISDRFISGNHAEFHRMGEGKYELRDLGSHNGTFVNGKKIERAVLKSGDRLRFGTVEATISEADSGVEVIRPPRKKTTKVDAPAPMRPSSGASLLQPANPPVPAPASRPAAPVVSPVAPKPAEGRVEKKPAPASPFAPAAPTAANPAPPAAVEPKPALAPTSLPAPNPTGPRVEKPGPAVPVPPAAPPMGKPIPPAAATTECRPPAPISPASLPRPGGSAAEKSLTAVPAPASPPKAKPSPAARVELEPDAADLDIKPLIPAVKPAESSSIETRPVAKPGGPVVAPRESDANRQPPVVQADSAPAARECESLRKQVALLNGQIAALRSKNEGLEEIHAAKTQGLKNKLATTQRENERYSNHTKRLENQVEELERRGEERTRENATRVAALEAELETLKTANREARDSVARAERQVAGERTAREEARSQIEKLHQDLRNQGEDFEAKTSGLEKARAEYVREKETQASALRKELDEIKALRHETEKSFTAEISILKESGICKEDALTKANDEIERLTRELVAADARLLETQKILDDKARDAEKQIFTLLEGIDQLKAQRQEAQDSFAASAAQIESLKSELAETKARLSNTESVIAAPIPPARLEGAGAAHSLPPGLKRIPLRRISSIAESPRSGSQPPYSAGNSNGEAKPAPALARKPYGARPIRVTPRKTTGTATRIGIPTPLATARHAERYPKNRSLHEHELKTQGIIPAKRPRISRIQLDFDQLPIDDDVVLLRTDSNDMEEARLKQLNLENAEAALKKLEESLFGDK